MKRFFPSCLMRRARLTALLCVVVVLAACSYVYQLRVTVVHGDLVGTQAMAGVGVIIAKAPHQRSELTGMLTLPIGENGVLATEICCTPTPEIWIYAFSDTNGSGRWEPDEPLVMDIRSPVRLTDDYATTLVLP